MVQQAFICCEGCSTSMYVHIYDTCGGRQEASIHAGDAELELRCRIAALQHLLPVLPDQAPSDEGRPSPPAGPPPKAVKEVQKPPKASLTRVSLLVETHCLLVTSQ